MATMHANLSGLLLLAAAWLPQFSSAQAQETACAVRVETGVSLSEAKNQFAEQCPGDTRSDCDLIDEAWTCSAGVLGAGAPAVARVGPLTATSEGLCYSPTASSLKQARRLFEQHCGSYTRRDCDPVADGWLCSSGVIGTSAPAVEISNSVTVSANAIEFGSSTIQTDGPTTTSEPTAPNAHTATNEPTDTSEPDVNTEAAVGRLGRDDLLVLHYDNCPDPDDGQAMAAALSVVRTLDLAEPLVVNGTCGHDLLNRFQQESVGLAQTIFSDQVLDAYNNNASAVETSINRWAQTLANGGDVWVAEGGPSDFTTAVLRGLSSRFPGLNLKRVHVVQHSERFNEGQTENIAFVRDTTSYVNVPNGNIANGSADLRMQSSEFVSRARASRDQIAWNAAFAYLPPSCGVITETCKLDFSDTVELLYIVGDDSTESIIDFADRYFR